MARKLKTFQTSVGFFDLAVAAPSMKAALDAWGAKANLFHQGFAKETDEAAVVAATLAKPGVVLRRAVGSNDEFREHARLPTHFNGDDNEDVPKNVNKPSGRNRRTSIDDRVAREAVEGYARQQKRRDDEHRRREDAETRARERRKQTIARARDALEEAERAHEAKVGKLAEERSALDQQMEAEEHRWNNQRAKLGKALDRARE